MKYQFTNDYNELVASEILSDIVKYQSEQNIAYGNDYHGKNAKKYISDVFGLTNSDIHFLSGGTQTNMVFISYVLRPYEGVICVKTGHINVHETASVEGSGHKVYTVDGNNGKIYPEDIIKAMELHVDEHMVKLQMVYISSTTEIGTIYTKKELSDLRNICDKYGLYLFLDGARLGSALTSSINDLDYSDLAKYTDAFYIGGTKNGLMIGEALVINNDNLKANFRYHIKNKGAMLAKNYLLGIEFESAFKKGLYFKLAKNANIMAEKIATALEYKNYKFVNTHTNQLFVEVDLNKSKYLIDEFGCELWEKKDNSNIIRIVTSFNTKDDDVDELIRCL